MSHDDDYDNDDASVTKSLEQYLAGKDGIDNDLTIAVIDWFTMAGAEMTVTSFGRGGSVFAATLGGVDYQFNDSTDGDDSIEIMATLVTGSALDEEIVLESVEQSLPTELPHGFMVDTQWADGSHCWLIWQIDDSDIADIASFNRAMDDFTSIAATFVANWTGV